MAYTEGNVEGQTFPVASATAFTANKFVTLGASGNVALPSSGGEVTGVAQQPTVANDTRSVNVAVLNGAKLTVEAGGTIAAGAEIASNTAGEAVAASTLTNPFVVGRAVEGASDGDVFTFSSVRS